MTGDTPQHPGLLSVIGLADGCQSATEHGPAAQPSCTRHSNGVLEAVALSPRVMPGATDPYRRQSAVDPCKGRAL
jgi:hypothetical protein